jgi:flagellar hook assembly protein FlgD
VRQFKLIVTVDKMSIIKNQIPLSIFRKKPLAKVLFSLFFLTLFTISRAQTATISQMDVAYPLDANIAVGADYWCGDTTMAAGSARSFWSNQIYPVNSFDPTVNSALIQFDQPYLWGTTSGGTVLATTPVDQRITRYPNHCLQLCIKVQCSSYLGSSPSPAFPIQSVTFEVFKFLEQSNPLDPKATPPIRTIQLYPVQDANGPTIKCAGYRLSSNMSTTGSASSIFYDLKGTPCAANGFCGSGVNDGATALSFTSTGAIDTNGTPIDDTKNVLTFCGAWDGSYNFDSEFAKTNGNFGYRAQIVTSGYQVDPNMPPINIDMTTAYPGQNQMPITVDVVDVHSVRTSPTVVGLIDVVAAQPYNIKYRLSKDANVSVDIYDASPLGNIDLGSADVGSVVAGPNLVRSLIANEPRLGERSPDGGQLVTDPNVTAITEVEPWDGRDDQGRFLPRGNYVVNLNANASDKWGNDVARAKQYQISLDPLKLTDLVVTGLNKMSTAYASLQYMLTEAATVYFRVYSPGTTFAGPAGALPMYTSDTGLGQAPEQLAGAVFNGTLIYDSKEQKGSRQTVMTKWDGRCNQAAGCTFSVDGVSPAASYGNGEYVPDGNYVYVIWAEIPYLGAAGTPLPYTNKAGNVFDAVKTRMYANGILPINRGQVDITIQPVGYSTMGSSPVAYGLDPFVFRYSISRESPVIARIKNTANVVVKTLVNNEVQVAQQMNQYTWDGKDDYGRFVSQGTYTFEVITKDPIYPDKQYSQTALFPIDIFRIVDVGDTPLLDQTNSEAKLSYALTKTMEVSVFIYDKGVVLPNDKTAAWPPAYMTNAATGQLSSIDPNTGLPAVPIKTFRGIKPGEGLSNIESWDGTRQQDNSYVSDGQYPYIIIGKATEKGTIYYDSEAAPSLYPASNNCSAAFVPQSPLGQTPLAANSQCGFGDIYASDHVTGFINVTRGPVYFLTDSIRISPTNPKMFHSTETIKIPSYTIEFTPSRTAQVNISIISRDGKDCYGNTLPAGAAQPVCRVLKNTNFGPFGYQNIFTGNISSRVFWDGKDDQGRYCANGAYTVLFQANGYPLKVNDQWSFQGTQVVCSENGLNSANRCTNAQLANPASWVCPDGVSTGVIAGTTPNRTITCPSKYEATETRLLEGNLFQVFDTFIQDIQQRNQTGTIAYQVSVPMKVAIQIFKPGTFITDYQTGVVSNGTLNYVACQETAAQSVRQCTAAQLANPNTACKASEFGKIAGVSPNRTITCTAPNSSASSERQLLVKSITGMRTPNTAIEEIWDGKDYAMQDVPDGIYPFRIVTSLQNNSSHIDSFYGDIDDTSYVADWTTYGNFVGEFVVARGDGQFVCPDWQKTVIFFPNPFRGDLGKFEVTKTPVPGQMSIKIYNIAGDLVREQGYRCVDQNGNATTMNGSLYLQPDNDLINAAPAVEPNLRNASVRCEWDKKNDHGKTVARGVYLGLVDFKATGGGREHCQKVVKIVIP